MAPRKKKKSLEKSPSAKCASPVIKKQNKRKNVKKTKPVNDSAQKVMDETFIRFVDGEGSNPEQCEMTKLVRDVEGSTPGKSETTKPVRDIEVVEDKNILSVDFIPFSTKFSENCTRNVGGEVETYPTKETCEVPVTIIVDDDDNDAESIYVDDSITAVDIEDVSVNDSIQIVEEGRKSHPCSKHKHEGDQTSPGSAKREKHPSLAKKRKIDDSIEILETIESVSNPRKKFREDKNFEDLSVSMYVISNSEDESYESHDQDDDIVIVETVDNNSRDSVKVVNDFIPLTMSPALVREKTRRKKTFVKKHRNHKDITQGEAERDGGISQSLIFEDTVGIAPGSAHYKSPLPRLANADSDTNETYHNVYGNNMYNPNNVEKIGLRPVVIDGSNVAFGHGGKSFSSRGIEICVNYFVKRGHRVVAFVPLFRRSEVSEADKKILDRLKKDNRLAFTPSRYLHGRRVASYDDRFIVQCAAELGGIVVSTDNYRDLVCENEAWRETIEKRLLMFTWVGDILMFPDDPNGRGGPRLEEFLRFPK